MAVTPKVPVHEEVCVIESLKNELLPSESYIIS